MQGLYSVRVPKVIHKKSNTLLCTGHGTVFQIILNNSCTKLEDFVLVFPILSLLYVFLFVCFHN